MTEKRFQLEKDTEWWFVSDNTIKVNEFGFRDDLTGEDKYRGLKQDLTEQETVDLLNELVEEKEYYQIKSGKCEEELLKLRRDNEQLKKELENEKIRTTPSIITTHISDEDFKRFEELIINFGMKFLY